MSSEELGARGCLCIRKGDGSYLVKRACPHHRRLWKMPPDAFVQIVFLSQRVKCLEAIAELVHDHMHSSGAQAASAEIIDIELHRIEQGVAILREILGASQ